MVGLIPFCAVSVIESEIIEGHPEIGRRISHLVDRNADLLTTVADPRVPGLNGRRLLSVLNEEKLRRVLARMLDEDRFLSPHGIRSLSKAHLHEPFVFSVHGEEFRVQYEPAESTSGLFGGNSNWRGPVWFPVNLLILRALLMYHLYYGDDLKVECPTGSGNLMSLFE